MLESGEMVHQAGTLATKPDDVGSVPGSQVVEGENQLLKVFLSPTGALWDTDAPIYPQTHGHHTYIYHTYAPIHPPTHTDWSQDSTHGR